MASGKVKWFNNKKGFGFIARDSGADIFVHHTSIQGKGYHTLIEGEVVDFELVDSDKGPKAEKVIRSANPMQNKPQPYQRFRPHHVRHTPPQGRGA